MKIPGNINIVRRSVMRFFTKNIGTSKVSSKRIEDPAQIKKILICRPNARLGNLHAQIDLFVKGGLMTVILKNYPQIGEIFALPKKPFNHLFAYLKVWLNIKRKKYNMVLNVDKDSSSGRLAVKISHAAHKFYGDSINDNEVKQDDYHHIAKYPVYNFREYLKTLGISTNSNPVTAIDIELSKEEIEQGRKILNRKFENQKQTIAIFTYATGDKCFSELWWTDFYSLLKRKYERDYNIIEILPLENVSQIRFKATSFYSKDIREIGAVIANTSIFIGADSGIMHLAKSVHVPVVGLFSVSSFKKYEPYGDGSIGIDVNTQVNKNLYILEMDRILIGQKKIAE